MAAPLGRAWVATAQLPESGAPVRLLRDIPELQQKITLDATDRPAGEVLAHLSPSLPVDLSAERDIADQRVTLHLVNQPVYLLMDRLTRLLSHHLDAPKGYQWGHLDRAAGTRPAYQLWRDGHSVNEEQAALDYPRREVAVMLRDLRDLAGMSPQDSETYTEKLIAGVSPQVLAGHKRDYPFNFCDPSEEIYAHALRGLSDSQLDDLVSGQSVPLASSAFTADVASLHQQEIDRSQAMQKSFLADHPGMSLSALALPPVNIPPSLGQGPLMLTVAPDSEDEDLLYDPAHTNPGTYTITLQGIPNSSLRVNTYDTSTNRAPEYVSLPTGPNLGPAIDLAPLLRAKGVTNDQRRDLGFTLQALAHAAGITVYQEDFLRGSVYPDPGSNPDNKTPEAFGLLTLKGPLPVLIAAICTHWNFQAQKLGDDYFFWSRTWAQYRADDIPERLLAPWRQRLQTQGRLTLNDHAEIAAALTWRQVSLTLQTALPEPRPWTLDLYRLMRVLGQLSPVQQEAMLSPDGLAFASLSPWQQQAFCQIYKKRLNAVSDDQLGEAVVTLEAEDIPDVSVERLTLTVKANDKSLMGALCVISKPSVPPLKPPL